MLPPWKHPICGRCYAPAVLDLRSAIVSIDEPRTERCCWCGVGTTAGLYVVLNAGAVPCNGDHRESPRASSGQPALPGLYPAGLW